MPAPTPLDIVIVPVILCGGSGTRLWPLSREQSPKQFLRLVSERSLFQEAARRAGQVGLPVLAPVVICHSTHEATARAQLEEIGNPPQAVLLEPVARNTAPAVAAAALYVRERLPAKPVPLMLVLPADHVVRDDAAFAVAVTAAASAALDGRLVTFGVVPNAPETGYGYIEVGAEQGAWSTVARFVEKPDKATAQRYLDSGNYLWNSGMFLFSAEAYLAELAAHEPGVLVACEQALRGARRDGVRIELGARFADAASRSIDYAVMERTHRAAVVPLAAGWSDVGSWPALHDVLDKDDDGNTIVGRVVADECRDTYVHASSRTVAAIGLEGIVIVETADAVLVMSRDHAQSVKRIAAAIAGDASNEPAAVPPTR